MRAAILRIMQAAVLIAAPAAAQGTGSFFETEVYPALERAQCRQCHQDSGVASRTRLQFPPPEAAPGEIRHFGLGLARLIDRGQPEQSLLLRKPTKRVEHTGGERIRQGSPEEAALARWIFYLAGLSPEQLEAALRGAGAPMPEMPVTARRLTHSQYNHTVRDLLGDRTQPADRFPPEDFVNGFRNQSEGQSISPLLAEAYNTAAGRLARNAFPGSDRHGLLPCQPLGPADAECRGRFLRQFGRRAFRRPLNDSELALYDRLFTRRAAATGDFFEGAAIVVEAMLQSPHFLFYTQPRAGRPDPYQTASRLSYFLWDTMPDEALLRAAESGELASREGIEQAARRMLADPRAQAALDEFLAQWLRFDRIRNAVRERRLYPEFSTELVAAMIEETRRLFGWLVWEDRSFMEFFDASYSFVNSALAPLYGLPVPETEFARVGFPESLARGGIVGQASFLTVTSKPAETSPTERGLFVREHFLCQTVPPPPAGVNTTLPPVTDEAPLNGRDRLAIHLSNEACAGCHRLVDPIGFGLEQYDAIGRFRETELVKIFPTADEIVKKRKTQPTEYQLPIKPEGYIQGLPGSEFASARELGRFLARDPGCQTCVVKQLFRYALGRHETAADRASIEAAFERFRDSGFRFQELVLAVVTSEPFLGASR